MEKMFAIENVTEQCVDFKGNLMNVIVALFYDKVAAKNWIKVQEEIDKRYNTYLPHRYKIIQK